MPVVRRYRRFAPLLALAVLLSGCVTDGPRSALHPVGEVAVQQMELFNFTLWLSAGVLAIVLGVLIYSILRFRRRETGDPDAIPNQTEGSVPLEITWTLIPVIIVILIAIPTVRTIFDTETRFEPTEDDVVVNVTGYQWWWRFDYPELGITTANEMHVPVDTRVVVYLETADVVHSYWVPKLAGKRDLIPNQVNQLWFTSPETGVFNGHCAELCLGAHAYMRFNVIVDEQDEFDEWVAAFQNPQEAAVPARDTQLVQDEQLINQGRTLVAQKGCIGCHTIDNYAEGMGSINYPDLTNFGLRTTVGAAVAPNTLENLALWIRDPQAIKPGNYMPSLWQEDDPNAEEESTAIAAYLLSLGVEGGQQSQAAVSGGSN